MALNTFCFILFLSVYFISPYPSLIQLLVASAFFIKVTPQMFSFLSFITTMCMMVACLSCILLVNLKIRFFDYFWLKVHQVVVQTSVK